MKITPTEIAGVFAVESDVFPDERGFVEVNFLRDFFLNKDLVCEWDRMLSAHSILRGMLRGLHYQTWPNAETKLVRCLAGAIYDVVVDVRPDSATYGKWQSFFLSQETSRMLYVPEGVAHGYQCLRPAIVEYLIQGAYCPESARGIVWDDPTLKIPWPIENPVVSQADRTLPKFKT